MARSAAQLWCPRCKEVHPCHSMNPSEIGETGGRRFSMIGADDVEFVRRFRRCDECGEDFETAEVETRFLDELVKLRSALADLKTNAAAYQVDADKAASQLKKLSKSLAVLRALD